MMSARTPLESLVAERDDLEQEVNRLRQALGLSNFAKMTLAEEATRLRIEVNRSREETSRLRAALKAIADDKDDPTRCLCRWYRGVATQVLSS